MVIGIGTRYSDFTTASKTAFQDPKVRFININVADFDAQKHRALPLVADAKVTISALAEALEGYRVPDEHQALVSRYHDEWDDEVERIYDVRHGPPLSQGEVIGAVNTSLAGRGVEPLPLYAIGIILGIDRIVDMCRTTVNVWGDAVGVG